MAEAVKITGACIAVAIELFFYKITSKYKKQSLFQFRMKEIIL